ncbi:MAG TPA: hypothetical protein VFA81_11905 [Burkholderiales bacterium]|nr:hypothetical protein [Burkholderiales bacterium]
MFPPDEVLIARGKYTTLSKERREQLDRVRSVCTTLITNAQATLRDCEAKPPKDPSHLETMVKCLENLQSARERITTLCLGMQELEEEAWG